MDSQHSRRSPGRFFSAVHRSLSSKRMHMASFWNDWRYGLRLERGDYNGPAPHTILLRLNLHRSPFRIQRGAVTTPWHGNPQSNLTEPVRCGAGLCWVVLRCAVHVRPGWEGAKGANFSWERIDIKSLPTSAIFPSSLHPIIPPQSQPQSFTSLHITSLSCCFLPSFLPSTTRFNLNLSKCSTNSSSLLLSLRPP